MTVIVKIGRRIAKNRLKQIARTSRGFVTFQQNIWLMINQSISRAKRKCDSMNTGLIYNIIRDQEEINLTEKIEWLIVKIQGTKEQEEEEYRESMDLYKNFGKLMKRELPKGKFADKFISKILPEDKLEKAYNEGMGSLSDKNLANKLNEMGILTHIEWIKDYKDRIPKL